MTPTTLSPALQARTEALLAACPLVPVIVIDRVEDAVPLGEALVAGGLRVLEITLRSDAALEGIRRLRAALPEVWVGAGTVASVAQYREAEAAGAQFVITPGSTPALLEHGCTALAPLLPGVATLSEMMLGHALGYRAFKFFPAAVAGGVPALKAFAGPFPRVRFVPTGGITPETAASYLALPNVAAVGGSWLTPKALIDQQDWEGITRLTRDSLAALQGG